MKLPALAAVACALSACATPDDRLETSGLTPVPQTAELAAAAGPGTRTPPPVVPSAEASAASKLLADVRTRGSATLADCFALAETDNEDLLSADEDRLQAWLRRDQAVAAVLPTLSTNVTVTQQDRVSDSTDGNIPSPDRRQWAFTVKQPIFRGLAELHAMHQATLSAEARAASIETLRASLRRSVARAFFGLLTSQADVRTLEEAEKLGRSRVDEMGARLEAGLARRTEMLLLESQLQETLAQLRRARTSVTVARSVLAEVLGVELPVPLAAPAASTAPVPARNEAVAEALKARPELRSAESDAAAAEESVAVVRGAYWPTVSFIGNWYVSRQGYTAHDRATDWDAMLVVDFPFFEGGATKAKERIAKSDLRKARQAWSRLFGGVVQDVESVQAAAAADAELLATVQRNAQIARENLGLLRAEYTHGIATSLEVLTAQNVLEQAELDLERQSLEYQLDRVELAIALGRTEIGP